MPLLYKRVASPAEYAGPDALVVVAEPRSLFDDTVRRRDELEAAAKAARFASVARETRPSKGSFSRRPSSISVIASG